MKDDRVYLAQIVDATNLIRDFVAGMENAAFLKDLKTQSAVIMQFTLIGELAKRISLPVKTSIAVPGKRLRVSAIAQSTITTRSISKWHGTRLFWISNHWRKLCANPSKRILEIGV
jgi:hypothetical protein